MSYLLNMFAFNQIAEDEGRKWGESGGQMYDKGPYSSVHKVHMLNPQQELLIGAVSMYCWVLIKWMKNVLLVLTFEGTRNRCYYSSLTDICKKCEEGRRTPTSISVEDVVLLHRRQIFLQREKQNQHKSMITFFSDKWKAKLCIIFCIFDILDHDGDILVQVAAVELYQIYKNMEKVGG